MLDDEISTEPVEPMEKGDGVRNDPKEAKIQSLEETKVHPRQWSFAPLVLI